LFTGAGSGAAQAAAERAWDELTSGEDDEAALEHTALFAKARGLLCGALGGRAHRRGRQGKAVAAAARWPAGAAGEAQPCAFGALRNPSARPVPPALPAAQVDVARHPEVGRRFGLLSEAGLPAAILFRDRRMFRLPLPLPEGHGACAHLAMDFLAGGWQEADAEEVPPESAGRGGGSAGGGAGEAVRAFVSALVGTEVDAQEAYKVVSLAAGFLAVAVSGWVGFVGGDPRGRARGRLHKRRSRTVGPPPQLALLRSNTATVRPQPLNQPTGGWIHVRRRRAWRRGAPRC
jgi:hypothetical protein